MTVDKIRYREQRNVLTGDLNILTNRGMRLGILTTAMRRRRVIYFGI